MPLHSLVAVIEDDADERTALGRILRAAGFRREQLRVRGGVPGRPAAASPVPSARRAAGRQVGGRSPARAEGRGLDPSRHRERGRGGRRVAPRSRGARLRRFPAQAVFRPRPRFVPSDDGGLGPKSNCPARFPRLAFGMLRPAQPGATLPVVHVVEDDGDVRRATARLLRSAGHAVQSHASSARVPRRGLHGPAGLRGARRAAPRDERPRAAGSNRAPGGRAPGRLRDRPRGHPDERPRHQDRRRGLPDQARPRSRAAGRGRPGSGARRRAAAGAGPRP